MRKRWFRLIAFILLAPSLLLVAFLLTEHVRGRIALARYKRLLVTQGVKLSPKDFASAPGTEENGAPEVARAYQELKTGMALPRHYPPVMRLTTSGRAVVGFLEHQWADGETTNRWNEVAADLETNQAALVRIRAALGKPLLDNELDFSRGARMSFKHLAPCKVLVRWFGARSQLALHAGRPQEALPNLFTCLEVPRLLARDHLLISELVRIAVVAMDRAQTWEALQADGWTDADLAQLQQAWQGYEFPNAMAEAMEGETLFCDMCCQTLRRSNADAADMLFGLEEFLPAKDWDRFFRRLPAGETLVDFAKKQVYCRVWRFAWLDQFEQHDLEQIQRLRAIARAGASGKSFREIQPEITRFEEEIANQGIYDRLRYPTESLVSLPRVMARAMRAETERSLTLCAIALKRYSLAHGRSPRSLDELVPAYLASVPIDYMDGNTLKYHLNVDGSFTLYSVGEDGQDDGGDPTLLPGKSAQNLWTRRDAVWPAPALPEELQVYRSEKIQN